MFVIKIKFIWIGYIRYKLQLKMELLRFETQNI